MDKLNGIEIFVALANSRSFAATAKTLGITPSAVSKSLSRLEERLGVRLFQRSTRVVSLTEEGRIYLTHCQGVIEQITLAENELAGLHSRPVGTLRVALPYVAGYFMPVLEEFARKYPDIVLDLDFGDRISDLIAEGFDVAIRTGEPADSRLIARLLGSYRHCIVASPAYLTTNGTPNAPEDLRRHRCLHYRYPTSGRLDEWALQGVPHLPHSLICNNLDALLYFAESGQGLACVPDFVVQEKLAQRRLVSVLTPFYTTQKTFRLIYASKQHITPKVRVFVDFIGQYAATKLLQT